MEILSENSLDFRVAVRHLVKDDSPHQYMLFPMVHVGEPEFYQEIHRRLSQCDIVLYEGINSTKGTMGIESYELVAKEAGLSLQKDELGKDNIINLDHVEFVCADLYKQEYEGYWRRIPLHEKILYNSMTLVQHLFQMINVAEGGKGRSGGSFRLSMRDELPDLFGKGSKINELFIKKRDRRLIHHMERQMNIHAKEPKTIGILFGAIHILAVMKYLIDELNYKVKSAEWLIAFVTE